MSPTATEARLALLRQGLASRLDILERQLMENREELQRLAERNARLELTLLQASAGDENLKAAIRDAGR
jgi:hypothetical protein